MIKTWTEFKAIITDRVLIIQMDEHDLVYKLIAYDGPQKFICNIPKANLNPVDENGEPLPAEEKSADQIEFETSYKTNANKKIGLTITKLPDAQPFAEPTYRTKHCKISAPVIIANGTSENIDYTLPAERYASGGSIVIKNGQFGDWIEASIQDPNGTIPAPYRAALCENWPTVAVYSEGQYIEVYDSNSIYHKQGIDTRPLVAKINAGLVLRVIYHAADIQGASSREVLVNYFLAKKL